MATGPVPSRGAQGGDKSIWLHNPGLLRVRIVGILAAILACALDVIGQAINAPHVFVCADGAYTSHICFLGICVVPIVGGWSVWLHSPGLIRVPIVLTNQYCKIIPVFSGSP